MELASASVLVTGGASGLGLATVQRLVSLGARVCIADRNPLSGADSERLADAVVYVQADVTEEDSLVAALDTAETAHGPLRGVVHTAGRGGDRLRILDRNGAPSPVASFQEVLVVNLVGTYNVLRLAAARMAAADLVGEERGAVVLTSSVAAFDGQIGQTSYTASKAAVHGITLVAARDLATHAIRVNTIAPGVFDTPMLSRLRPDLRSALEATVPHPHRLGRPEDYAHLAVALLENPYINGETVRLDGSIRMAPR